MDLSSSPNKATSLDAERKSPATATIPTIPSASTAPSARWSSPAIDLRWTAEDQASARSYIERANKLAPRLEKMAGFYRPGEFRAPSGMLLRYQLFTPTLAPGEKHPLIVYFHGSGGQGDDNRKQVVRNTIWGTGLWLLPENQSKHPCFVLAPQTPATFIKDHTHHLPRFPPTIANTPSSASPAWSSGSLPSV